MAEFFNSYGIAAFVLEYRVAPYQHPVELMDATRAMRWLRAHAAEYHINPDHIGILGCSAGGHLAASLSTHYDAGDPTNADPIERASSRPDFAILLYPVINGKGPASIGSFNNLLGTSLSQQKIDEFSPDKHVTAQTPPTFLALADDDKPVFPDNSIDYYRALHLAGVSAEIHIYQSGGHGFGVALAKPIAPAQWRSDVINWMVYRGYLPQPQQK
jgi:acetyl esterase/lipase